ncbi:MAG: PilZ domain-containing protein [Desulfobacterales bacterium]|nr:PilZ domain-containing protein [Desulfobacterales bacterium]
METAYDFDGYRRASVRKNYQKEVSFSYNSMILQAVAKNVSLGGALISGISIPKIELGTKIFICIPFALGNGNLKRKAKVKWVDNNQFGIEFI